jgi:hypothetical protein
MEHRRTKPAKNEEEKDKFSRYAGYCYNFGYKELKSLNHAYSIFVICICNNKHSYYSLQNNRSFFGLMVWNGTYTEY